MSFQSTVRANQASGVPGEIAFDGPKRALPAILNSADAAYNIIGATAFTYSTEVAATGGGVPLARVVAGGLGVFAGILANPKVYASGGTNAGGTLAPTMTLPNGTEAELVQMGEMWVTVPGAANVGDPVQYNTTTGVLSTVPKTVSGTGSITTTVLTVSAVDAGSGKFAVDQVLVGPNIVPGTRIVSLGTGTGGTGTYNVSVSQTAASAAVSANPKADSGNAFVPNTEISRRTVAGAGLACIKLTN